MKRLTLSTKIPSVLCPLFTALEDDNEYCQSQNADCLCCELGEQLIKLAEYEDAEEQGLLIRLPCKVGDVIYRINKGARYPVIALVVTEIRQKALKSGKVILKIICSDDIAVKTNGCLVYYPEEIGKKIWLTREEAEAALAEMEG